MAKSGFASIESMSAQAEGLVAQGRLREAEECYRELIAQTHVIDIEYDDWLRKLSELYGQLGRDVEAGYIYLYLHYFDLARSTFQGEEGVAERARVAELEKRWAQAAELYREARMPVHAAVALEKAKAFDESALMWESLIKDPRLRERPYERALVHFNYGMALNAVEEDGGNGRRALIESQQVLEQVADDFETVGERERAFDCYQILLKLGRESEQYENLAEGYLNCIRVLKDDGLKFYVLQYYEDFIEMSLERDELHAAATLYQEAADFSSRSNLPYGRNYQALSARTWSECASKFLEEGAPVSLVENALRAAIAGYSAVGNYEEVRDMFERLGELDLPDSQKERYRQVAAHYKDARNSGEDSPAFPDYLKKQHAYADIWFVDLLEWELGGLARSVALSIIGNLRYPDGIRRRALVVALTLADAAQRSAESEVATLEAVCELLGELQSYAALCPLERLFEHQEPQVRRAAVRAMRFLFFKRSFSVIRRALEDPDEGVKTAAIEALRGLHFPHAFNPLARIYRESDDERVRVVALSSIGRIQSIESGEFLLSVLRQESGELRDAARRALGSLDNPDVLPILRQYYQIETNPEVAEQLAYLLRGAQG